MHPGAKIADRYRIEEPAASGGMGTVYQGRDLHTGALVAIKLLHRAADDLQMARFWREARTLASLDHHAVVSYFGHGFTASGQPYLVTEWLSGEDLGTRLERGPLSVEDTIAVGLQVAGALAAAHRQRLLHRDIKPGNVFLVGGDPRQVKLLDFGLARLIEGPALVADPERTMGTPGYIAPEQARGDAALDERVDIYSLGAVLFACLTQRPPYIGAHIMAIIAKLMFAEVPHVSEVRTGVPPALDELIVHMLQRQPAERLADVAEVAEILSVLQDDPEAVRQRRNVAVSIEEQRFLSVLLVVHDEAAERDLTALASEHDGRLARLAPGTSLAVFAGSHDPVDTATRAARAALAIRTGLHSATIVLASGRGLVDRQDAPAGPVPVGQVIDRAVDLLMGDERTTVTGPVPAPDAAPSAPVADILLDSTTASLLATRFAIDELGGGDAGPDSEASGRWRLIDESPRLLVVRSLLGRPTRCIGRDRELDMLEDIYDQCTTERSPRVVLVTGPAGAGKSRIGYELIRRLQARAAPPRTWTARADPLRSGTSLALLADMIRSALGFMEPGTQRLEDRQHRIIERVQRCVPPAEVRRVAEFLAEIVNCSFTGEGRVQLLAARDDARLMHDQIRRAWEDWLGGEVTQHPVLAVLDDLQWGDLPTIRFLDSALRQAPHGLAGLASPAAQGKADAARSGWPFMVLALARSEVHEVFHDLWAGPHLEEIRLQPLSAPAARKLVRRVLGRTISSELVDAVIDRARGNAYYLEEFIRQVALGKADQLPETVVALVQAQLAALSPGARRVLRAASIFGSPFWTGGVVSLVGDPAPAVREGLDELVGRELIIKSGHTRFSGQDEYEFGHALIREAAYRLLPEADLVRGHARAGEWLLDAGESEPLVLAEHFQRGGDVGAAIEWYRCAAEDSLAASDLQGTIARAGKAIACGASGETLGALYLLQAEAYNWDGATEPALASSKEAMRYLPEGSAAWANAAHYASWAANSLDALDDIEKLVDRLLEHAGPAPAPLYVAAMARCATILVSTDRMARGRELTREIEALLPAVTVTPVLSGTIAHMHGWLAAIERRLEDSCDHFLEAVDYWTQVGNERSACLDGYNVCNILAGFGAYQQAETTLRTVLVASHRLGLDEMIGLAEGFLALVLARNGKLDEAEAHMRAASACKQTARSRCVNDIYWAEILLLAGRPDEAHAISARAAAALIDLPGYRALAHAVAGQALLAGDRADEARRHAVEAYEILQQLGEIQDGNALVRLVYSEVLDRLGERDTAIAIIRVARERLLDEASTLRSPERRRSFLENIAEHRRILELAEAWAV